MEISTTSWRQTPHQKLKGIEVAYEFASMHIPIPPLKCSKTLEKYLNNHRFVAQRVGRTIISWNSLRYNLQYPFMPL